MASPSSWLSLYAVKMPNSNFKVDEVTLILIVAIIAIIVTVHSKINAPKEMEAEKIKNILLDNHKMSLASKGVIDKNKLNEIKNMAYSDLKASLNAKNDFCFYIEEGNGNIILAKGSSKLNKDGIVCKE